MGFENFSSVFNLGGIFLIMLLYPLEVVVSLITLVVVWQLKKSNNTIVRGCKGKAKRKLIRWDAILHDNMVWTSLIVMVYESIVQMTIAFILQFHKPDFEYDDDLTQVTSDVSACICLILIILISLLSIYLFQASNI